ncbi:hypothetical protein JCM8208_004568 [Rhodotorula glutinis]
MSAHGPRAHSAPHSTSVTLHFKERGSRQPLYRPAALRRNGSVTREMYAHPSPPLSPSLAATEAKSSSWLSSLVSPSLDAPKQQLDVSSVRGRMLPRSQWKRDDEAEQCADPDCSQRFDLLNRRHHCRTCGDIFCASHSSRSTFLWPSAGDDAAPAWTPRGTPRATPRSSAVDLPSLAYSVSPSASAISCASSNNSSSTASSSTPTSSPPSSLPSLMPLSARVCDRCYFSVPDPSGATTPLLTPPVPGGGAPINPWSFADSFSRPMTLRHPHSRASSASRASSPAHSPPGAAGSSERSGSASRGTQARSRQGSATSGSSSTAPSTSEYSTPSTSVERLPCAATAGSSSSAGTSPEELCMAQAALQRRRKNSLSLASRRAASASRGTLPAPAGAAPGASGLRASSVPPRRQGSSASLAAPSASQAYRAQQASHASASRSKAHAEEDESDASTEVEDDAPRAADFASFGPPRAGAGSDDDDESDDDDDERHNETIRERRRLQQEYGSVGMSWATF